MGFKILISVMLSLQLFCYTKAALAAPPEEELNQYLTEIGWTNQDQDFQSAAELKNFLGTPINSTNYQELLTRYGLTDKQLKELLEHFGDSRVEYKYIEDLDNTARYYLKSADVMTDIKLKSKQFGISEQEAENFFAYLALIEENNPSQLDKIPSFANQMEKYLGLVNSADLTDQDIDELAKLLTEAIDLYDIRVVIRSNNQEISLYKLLKMKEAQGNLFFSIYGNTGKLLIDFIIPAEFFEGVVNAWNGMLHLGVLSNEFVDLLHNEKYNKADIEK